MTDEAPQTAAELALGLLEREERAAALRRVLADPDFAREVEAWRAHLALLTDEVAPVQPSDAPWQRIERSLTPVVSHARSARSWQIATALASLAAVAACLMLVILRIPPRPAARAPASSTVLVAQLAAPSQPVALAALYDADARRLRLTRHAAPFAPTGKGEELWVIAGKLPPRAIGMIGPGGATFTVAPANAALIAQGATLAVSIEPPGGSPTGAPTGAVVATGPVTRV